MFRPTPISSFVLVAALATGIGCDSEPVTAPDDLPEPVSITETFPADAPGTLTPNGGRTHPFAVQRAGLITAAVTLLAPDSTVTIGLSMGTWNGAACTGMSQANDAITQGQSLTGEATSTGNYCVRVYDASGSLTQPVQYQITVTHF
jgi:hypothetical protein